MTSPADESSARNYEFFCLASLLVLLLVLLHLGLGLASLIPFLLGLGGISGRWRLALPLILGSLVVLLTGLFSPWRSYWQMDEDPLVDLILAAAVLGYAAGQYRLRGLADGIFPVDPRVRQAEPQKATERGDLGREMAILVVSLPGWGLLAQLGWEQLPTHGQGLGLSAGSWRLLILTWLLGVALVIGTGLVAYLNRTGRTAMEAAIFLQDVLWRETRREQRRLYRRAAWLRLRAQRRGEPS